jgi:hypothetical protein
MSNVKAQSSNEFQVSKFKLEMAYYLTFGIPLAFVCLREAVMAKAGILTFEIY